MRTKAIIFVLILSGGFVILNTYLGRVTTVRAKTSIDANARGPSTHAASPEDIRVIVIIDKVNFITKSHPSRVGAVAYLINISNNPVFIYVPGFVGPIIRARGPKEGVPLELHVAASHGEEDTRMIGPGEMIGRLWMQDAPLDENRVSAYYTIYNSGFEGKQDQIRKIVYSIQSNRAEK